MSEISSKCFSKVNLFSKVIPNKADPLSVPGDGLEKASITILYEESTKVGRRKELNQVLLRFPLGT